MTGLLPFLLLLRQASQARTKTEWEPREQAITTRSISSLSAPEACHAGD